MANGRALGDAANAGLIRLAGSLPGDHAQGANPPDTVIRDNYLPIVEAGQALLVDDDYASDDTITRSRLA